MLAISMRQVPSPVLSLSANVTKPTLGSMSVDVISGSRATNVSRNQPLGVRALHYTAPAGLIFGKQSVVVSTITLVPQSGFVSGPQP